MKIELPDKDTVEIVFDYNAVDLSCCDLPGSQAIILTHDGRLLLQLRDDWLKDGLPLVTHFGGGLEAGETMTQALLRELHEELGATVSAGEVVWLGARVKPRPDGSQGVGGKYFWHDRDSKITGCYEGSAVYLDSVEAALTLPNLHDAADWALRECLRRGLIAV